MPQDNDQKVSLTAKHNEGYIMQSKMNEIYSSSNQKKSKLAKPSETLIRGQSAFFHKKVTAALKT